MTIKFQINCPTKLGQSVYLSSSVPELGNWNNEKALPMVNSDGRWNVSIEIQDGAVAIEYFYFIKTDNHIEKEFGPYRTVFINSSTLSIWDTWRSNDHESNLLSTSPFKRAFFNRTLNHDTIYKSGNNSIVFHLSATRIDPQYSFCITGSSLALGNWNQNGAIILHEVEYANWQANVPIEGLPVEFEYKYAIYNKSKSEIIKWEEGNNRIFRSDNGHSSYIVSDEYFGYTNNWKGTGVAIPIFSIRTKNSFGVGEFTDLKLMVQWAKRTGLNLIQILPVNDTTATHTWTDSYPYSGISVFALHPIYASIDAIGKLENTEEQKELDHLKIELNKSESLDYEQVIRAKWHYFKLKFEEVKVTFLKREDFKQFLLRNKEWLVPYAVFCYLRDEKNTSDFNKWGDFKSIDWDTMNALNSSENVDYDKIAIHYFVQFHLDQQLKEVSEYARKNSVVLKGDIPIGVCRNSVDVWLSPKLFNLNGQSGAPPDAFSDSGQNWGFPTYNWDEMAMDNYQWWRHRLQKMEDFFDVFRIDHILGFFRIWEIPYNQIEGTLGVFNPAFPYSKKELEKLGIDFNGERDCKPYINKDNIQELFGEDALKVTQSFFDSSLDGSYSFKPEFDSQRKVMEYFDAQFTKNSNHEHLELIRKGLMKLHREVIFIRTADGKLNPNIGMFNTHSFKSLKDSKKDLLRELHDEFFFNRHNEFWRAKAMEKLPALKSATEMLVCGEDLGMVPGCVHGVMHDLQLLSLTIQRMPLANTGEFWDLNETSYLSVCSPGTHDVSTIRAWWEEDTGRTQRFYNDILGNKGEAPFYCEPWIVKQIIDQHLQSPAMWSIIPIQDLMALDETVRRVFPKDEQINRPEISQHYWKYRMHITLEDLLIEGNLNSLILEMVKSSERYISVDSTREELNVVPIS
ncbi:MAG: 4-alpha-glucanotransferase [Bacteroidetes bacterium]|nr:4-alpha-glucanotransferase [Bacteroidota bacterium]MDA1121931.1 4-alpha-glucanotransferase [Bacteroidota bacterium]